MHSQVVKNVTVVTSLVRQPIPSISPTTRLKNYYLFTCPTK